MDCNFSTLLDTPDPKSQNVSKLNEDNMSLLRSVNRELNLTLTYISQYDAINKFDVDIVAEIRAFLSHDLEIVNCW